MTDPLIESLLRAVQAAPNDVPLRLHLAGLLIESGRSGEAVEHCAAALQADPGDAQARALMARALGGPAPAPPGGGSEPAAGPVTPPNPTKSQSPSDASEFDWTRAEADLGPDSPQPMFLDDGDEDPAVSAYDVEQAGVTLRDVGGMSAVKERLEASFLAPMRNPELRKLYGKSLRGGLLLYGPPGCGKTFVGRALAGEMGASFISVGISDILDMYIGQSERNLAELFTLARAKAPTVLFLDEVDALGQRRSMTRNSGTRNTVNQLLTELDGVSASNDGVYVVGATNQPWDVDPALRRPGRFDRTLFVSPPDESARTAIFRTHLAGRPVEGVDLKWLAAHSRGFSGADIAHACETGAERALLDGVRTGNARLISMNDLKAAVSEVQPSTGPWFESARMVVEFANADGAYDELRAWLKGKHR